MLLALTGMRPTMQHFPKNCFGGANYEINAYNETAPKGNNAAFRAYRDGKLSLAPTDLSGKCGTLLVSSGMNRDPTQNPLVRI